MNKCAEYPELDSIYAPLDTVNVIEAAAGTGKTYNIQNLVARMIVELDYPIDKIVVVTFTKFAAKELSERLHAVLEMLYRVLQGQQCASENDRQRAEALIAAFDEKNISRSDQQKRLRTALQDFDKSWVATIHSFCARVLSENAFESSVAFKVRMENDITEYVNKLINDYCRSKCYLDSLLPTDRLLNDQNFISAVNLLLARPDMKMEIKVRTFDSEADIAAALDALINELLTLTDAPETVSNIPGKLKKLDKMSSKEFIAYCADKLRRLQQEGLNADRREWLEVLDKLARAAQKDNIFKSDVDIVQYYMQQHRIFAIAREYTEILMYSLPLFRLQDAAAFVREKLAIWKAQDNFQSFDDLLYAVHDALKNDTLCEVLQKKFHAGIIDEFQDTDPLQYAIFKRIFIDREQPGSFFMVGDPRQAIYAFRGGDLATYLTARSECMDLPNGHIYKLSCNYRSSGALIDSFNKLFDHGDFFAASGLRSETVLKPKEVKSGIYKDGEEMLYPLQVRYAPEDSKEELLAQCAGEILHLLNDKTYQLMDKGSLRNVQPGDIAVLTFDKKELKELRKLLAAHNVPVICEYKNGIWGSAEAADLAVFLGAVLDNQQDSLLREALLSRLCGISLKNIASSMDEQPEVMHNWRLIFAELSALWQRSGIASMMAKAFSVKWDGIAQFKSRIAASRGGERCITNFMQLGDLLAAAELNEHLSPRGLLNYLNHRIERSHEFDSDESAEMMESDRTAVKLMTIHSSKGLQFPIVFLPDMSRRYPFKFKGIKSFHRGSKLCCNPDGTDAVAVMQAMIEEMQEIMRLIYVAVTRACAACFMTWGKNLFAGGRSGMDWLFRMQNVSFGDRGILRSFLQKLHEQPDVMIDDDLQRRDLTACGTPEDYYGEFTKTTILEPPVVAEVGNNWRLLSYSALVLDGTASTGDEFADYDDCDNEENYSDSADTQYLTGGIWDIPGGAAIGNAWHKILEVMDFQQPVPRREVQKIMQFYNFDTPSYIDGTCSMLETLIHHKLPCNVLDRKGGFFTLADISRSQRLNEFEFLLGSPGGVDMRKVLAAVEPYLRDEFHASYDSSEREIMQGGFFTGFMDLFFEHKNKLYIVDWKSNTLGRRKESFYGDALKRAMYDATYPMQYLCYTAAAVRYLEHRLGQTVNEKLYDERFGGIYYIFLRGMTFNEPGGIFGARPPLSVVRNLLEALGCREGDVL